MPIIPGSLFSKPLKFVRSLPFEEYCLRRLPYAAPPYLRGYFADAPDGVIKVVVAHEPAGTGGRLLWHISISHCVVIDEELGLQEYIRCPTWDEMKMARYQFTPHDIEMALSFPALNKEPWLNDHPTTLHLFEVENPQP